MIKLNDHYFISWIKVIKQKKINISNNKVYVDITPVEYTEYLEEYSITMKPLLKEIRKTVKELNFLTSQPN